MSTRKQEIDAVHTAELYLYFYQAFISEENTITECNLIAQHCQLNEPKRILDLACGHGRHSNFFAGQKHQLTGLDINSAFLALAKTDAKRLHLSVEYLEQDIRQIDYNDEFDAVILLYNSLGFFDKTDAQQLLQQIYRALKPGGRAFIDTKNGDNFTKEMSNCSIHEQGQDLMIDRLSFDPTTRKTNNRRIYIKDGTRYDAPFSMQLFYFDELMEIVDIAGFKVIKILGNWKGENYQADSRRVMLVLEK